MDVYVSFSPVILGPWTPNLFQSVAYDISFKSMSKYGHIAAVKVPKIQDLVM